MDNKFTNEDFKDIDCEFLEQGPKDGIKFCKLVSESKGFKCQARPALCKYCLNHDIPKQIGNPFVRQTGLISAEQQGVKYFDTVEDRLGTGPGTELHKMIPKFLENPDCNCKSWAKKMNIWGVDKCEENIEYIVDRLVTESRKRAIFAWVPDMATRTIAYNLAQTAIKRARKDELNNKWAVAVTTAPRREPTLSVCLESLLIAGWNPYIFAEPGDYPSLKGEYKDRTIKHETKKGVWWNWIESCRWCLNNTDAEVIMTVQDDSLFHPDSKILAEKFMWPREDVGFMSLYTPKHYSKKMHLKSRPDRPIGLNRIATKSLWGACALIWPRKVLEQVMEHDLIEGWLGSRTKTNTLWEKKKEERRKDPSQIQNSDTAIGGILNRLNRSMWFFDPSPVQHIARYSAINHGGNEGRRNCGRCAKYSQSIHEQLPFHINGSEEFELVTYNQIKI